MKKVMAVLSCVAIVASFAATSLAETMSLDNGMSFQWYKSYSNKTQSANMYSNQAGAISTMVAKVGVKNNGGTLLAHKTGKNHDDPTNTSTSVNVSVSNANATKGAYDLKIQYAGVTYLNTTYNNSGL